MTEKSKDIVSYLNDNMDAIIENKLSIKEIADKFNVTKQLVCYRIDHIDDTIFEQRDKLINDRLEIIRNQIMEGIPLEKIFENPIASSFLTERGKESIHRAKDLVLNRMRSRGIVDDNDEINRYTFVDAKLKNYINIVQIEQALRDEEKHLWSKAEISRIYGASYVKVLKISDDMSQEPEYRALQNLPKQAYETLVRNTDIAIQHKKGKSFETMKKEHSNINEQDLNAIIESYEPYIIIQ